MQQGPLVLPFSAGGGDAGRVYFPVRLEGLDRSPQTRLNSLWGAPVLAAFTGAARPGNRHRGSASPGRTKEIFNPEWLTIPERGLYTGIAIFGAVGSGKTSACMHPFAKQLLSWQAGDPDKRAAALMLEVKGDFCHDIRSILDGAGRG